MIEEMDEDDIKSVRITLIPPNQGQHSDEDNNDEEEANNIHLSCGQLVSRAEMETECMSHTISTMNNFPETSQPLRRSNKINRDT